MALGSDFDAVLEAARRGDEQAWRRLYDDLAPVVLGYLRGRGSSDPEGLVGEVFLRIARSLTSFEGGEDSFRSWVFTIAHHRLIDERRKRSRWRFATLDDAAGQLPPVHDEPEALERLTTTEVRALLEEVLTEDQRDVLLLRVVGGLTIPEIARIVGRTENATKALQRRGLRALERHLANADDDPYPSPPSERSQR